MCKWKASLALVRSQGDPGLWEKARGVVESPHITWCFYLVMEWSRSSSGKEGKEGKTDRWSHQCSAPGNNLERKVAQMLGWEWSQKSLVGRQPKQVISVPSVPAAWVTHEIKLSLACHTEVNHLIDYQLKSQKLNPSLRQANFISGAVYKWEQRFTWILFLTVRITLQLLLGNWTYYLFALKEWKFLIKDSYPSHLRPSAVRILSLARERFLKYILKLLIPATCKKYFYPSRAISILDLQR